MALAYKAWAGEVRSILREGKAKPQEHHLDKREIVSLHQLAEDSCALVKEVMEMHMAAPARAQEALDIEQEYSCMLRAQSNARFLLNKHQPEEEMEALLGTQEDLISAELRNILVSRRTSSEIEHAMANYFDASTEALEMCRQLLQNIKSTQSTYKSMDNFLASITDSTASTSASALKSFPVTTNPFSTKTRSNFRQIHEKYSSILKSVRLSHRRVARKLKIVKVVKKLSRALLVMACGGAAAAAIGVASHLLVLSVVIGAAAMRLLPIALKKRIAARASKEKRSSMTMSLQRLQEQLDTMAKGTYVLGMDLDTMSNLVARLSDGIEREIDMARFCKERSRETSSVMEMVNELRKSCLSSMRLTDELQEHVCMFLATIYRARTLVIKEISKKA